MALAQVAPQPAAQQPAAGQPQPDAPPDDRARRSCYLDLALALAAGVGAAGVSTLFKAARASLQEKEGAVQKRAYKVLAYICEQRPDFMGGGCGGLQQ